MDNLEKLGLVINNGLTVLGKKLDTLLAKDNKPIVNVAPPEVTVTVPDVIVPEIKIPEFPAYPNFPEYPPFPEIKIPQPIVNIEKSDPPIVNIPAPIVNVPAPVVNIPPVEFPKEMVVKGMDRLIENTGKEIEQPKIFEEVSSKQPLPIMVIGANGKQVIDFGGDMTAPSIVGIKNAATPSVQINPATQETLALIKTKLDSLTFTGSALQTTVTIQTGDIEIGAIEIKNSTDDTRATVGANGLHVDVQTSVLPTGASTSALQVTSNIYLSALAGTVNGTDLSIRDLTSVTDSVSAVQSGTWNIGTVATITNPVAVTGTFWQATQPVSGTVAVTQSTSPWIIAGGGTAGVSGTAVLTIQGIASGTAVPVSGTFFQATQPVSIAATVTVDGSGVTQPVSNAGLTELAAAINASSQMDVNIAASGATVPVSLTSTTVTGTVAVTQSGTWDEVGINDSGNSITVDNNGTFAVQADTELTTADLDTGAGTDTRAVIGLVGSKSGGGELIPGSATDGLLVNLGANNDVVVSATDLDIRNLVAATDIVDLGGNALTSLQLIDNAISGAGFNITQFGGAAVPIGAGLETTAIRVTLPTDGTGKVTVVSGTAANLKAEVTIAAAQTLATVTTVGTVSTITNTVPTKEIRAATAAQTTVADNAASTTILAANANRLGATVSNDSSAVLYLLLGSTAASATSYSVRMVQYGYYEIPFGYTGQLTGIWASDPNDGAARITEITA